MPYGCLHNLDVARRAAEREGRAEDVAQMKWAIDEIKRLEKEVDIAKNLEAHLRREIATQIALRKKSS